MNLPAFVLLILIVEKTFSFELEEAVFQGKCKKENLCSQLCYEVNETKLEFFEDGGGKGEISAEVISNFLWKFQRWKNKKR